MTAIMTLLWYISTVQDKDPNMNTEQISNSNFTAEASDNKPANDSAPASKTPTFNPKRRRFFIKLTLIVYVLTLICAIGIIINYRVLPSKGLYVNTNNSGMSMYPTLKSGALLLCAKPSAAPFEKLETGDIVVCMRRTSQTGMNFVITDNGIVGSGSFTITPGYAGKDDRDAYYKEDENAVYDPNQIYVHRIVEVNEVGDRVLFTRGDNNPDEDSPAVYKGGYESKVIWYMNGAGWIFWFMFESCIGLLIFAVLNIILFVYVFFLMPGNIWSTGEDAVKLENKDQ